MKYLTFFLCSLLLSQVSGAQSIEDFKERRSNLLKSLNNVPLKERGKHGLPKACARLWNNPKDTVATQYITHVLENKGQSMFDFPGIAFALGRYRSSFTPRQLAIIQLNLERLAKPVDKVSEGFMGQGTENQANMLFASAYLFGQYFPDAKWANGMTSNELKSLMKENLRVTFKNVYAKGYSEYISTTYEVVMNFPIYMLAEFSEDPEMKAIAKSYLYYKWSLSALNNFEGYIISPTGRMNFDQDFWPQLSQENAAATSYVNWLYWGWGDKTRNVELVNFRNKRFTEITYAIYLALSNVIPEEIFFSIANGNGVPYTITSSAASFGPFGNSRARLHMMMRKVYRDRQFAIGTGNFRWYPGGDYADHDTNGFSITWHSSDRFNYINCTHPFWYSDGDVKDRTPDTWYKGDNSPFQQTAQYKNVAICLFNIPKEDPWPNKPDQAKWAWRDGHADNLMQRAMLRFPKSVDEIKEESGWIFLREADTYIAIKPLKEYYMQDTLKGRGLTEFNIVKSDFAKTGFIFELSTQKESGSFLNFKKQIKGNMVAVDWDKLTVSYSTLAKDNIQIRYKEGLPIDADGLANSIPLVKINGIADTRYESWPLIKSPSINMDNEKLSIGGNTTSIIINWKGTNPVIQKD